MNKTVLFSFFLIVLALFSCNSKKEKQKNKPPVTVDVIIAEKVNFPVNVEVNGSALSEEKVELHPEVSGRLVILNIPDGAYVYKGSILAKINDSELQAQMEQLKVQMDLAVKTEQRMQKLLAVNGVNQSEYDAALSQVNLLNANINLLNAQIEKTIIRAPFNGRLGLRMVSIGAYVTPQTLLSTLQQTDNIKIDFSVPETYANFVKVGNIVQIQTNESDTIRTAIISAIEPQINLDSRNIKVRAHLSGTYINPGAFVKVILSKDQAGFMVPSNAIIPDATSNQLVIIKNNKAVFVNVETGIRNADEVEVLSGINIGDTIVVSGVLFVKPGGSVKLRNVQNRAGEKSESKTSDKQIN